MTPLQVVSQEGLVGVVAVIGGLGVLAGVVAAVIALGYRWYARERLPQGIAVLVGLSVVALSLNTTVALTRVIGNDTTLLTVRAALTNTTAFVVGAALAVGGSRVGDRIGTDVFAFAGVRELDADVGQLVRTVGRVVTVELPDDPDDIEDIENYDPVDRTTKEQLAGKTLVFPRRLTVEQLRERLVDRLRTDYSVGYVDVDLTGRGEVEYLALGSRIAGIGPTLPPGSAAVAVRADPAFAASPGDVVQVWRTGEVTERVATAEVRGTAGDTATLAVDDAETERFSPTETYRLVTLPAESRPDREFASLLRAAAETMGVVTVAAGSSLAGSPLGALDVSVVAVRPAGETVETLPPRSRVLAPGDTVYAVARPDALRQLEAGAAATGE
ncbi:MAG: potassium transporter TrkA [Haloarculaceae archaeon]